MRLFGRKKASKPRDDAKWTKYVKLVQVVERQLSKKEARLERKQEMLRRKMNQTKNRLNQLEERFCQIGV